ncbi:hypothetical protein BJY01DRAFT_250731 [Aspergillus pseudoustus]|uniref:EthD domain-containing protein n=1 Tax=Aspergillus pseudoustus TaxID=1810923 RepID=A0ABR4JJ46_9EURO
MATLNRNLRVTMFAFKKDEISEEEFHNHWSKVHAPIVAEFLAKAGVIRYTQYHTPSAVRKEVREHYERLGAPHRPFPGYDGLVEIVVPNMETYMSLSKGNIILVSVSMETEVLKPSH